MYKKQPLPMKIRAVCISGDRCGQKSELIGLSLYPPSYRGFISQYVWASFINKTIDKNSTSFLSLAKLELAKEILRGDQEFTDQSIISAALVRKILDDSGFRYNMTSQTNFFNSQKKEFKEGADMYHMYQKREANGKVWTGGPSDYLTTIWNELPEPIRNLVNRLFSTGQNQSLNISEFTLDT